MSTTTAGAQSGYRRGAGFAPSLREDLGGESWITRTRKPYGRLWPNGQFSLSYQYETDDEGVSQSDDWNWVKGIGLSRGGVGETSPALSLSQLNNSHTTEETPRRELKKYGLKGITPFGRKMVRSGAYLLQKIYGNEGMCFLTLTVPALGKSSREKLAKGWGEVMRQTLQYLSRRLREGGQAKLIVSVTELQTRRFQKYGQAYLHSHLAFPARTADNSRYVCDVNLFRSWFKSLLERILEEKIKDNPRVEAKRVRKSVEGYLGKYMTKGAGEISSIVQDLGESSVPGQQWNMTQELRNLVKSYKREGFRLGAWLQTLADELMQGGDIPGYWNLVKIQTKQGERSVAWVGLIPEEFREGLLLPRVDTSAIILINQNSVDST